MRVVHTRNEAEKMFRTFYDRQPRRATELPFGWPTEMQEIGEGKAEIYRSNKWKKNLSEFDDYKHVVESTRTVYATPGFLREWGSPHREIPVVGPMVTFEEPMPKEFTRLAPLLGVQMRLYAEDENGDIYLPKGSGEKGGLYEVTVARAYLGGARHPETKETFLFVYDGRGVHIILTGKNLTVEKDGIAG